MDELDHFTAFSTWLRFQIDRLASSSEGEELTEKEATMDNGRVLTYIERYLTGSPLGIFFGEIPKEDYDADWNHIEDGASPLDVLTSQLKKIEKGQDSMKALPRIEFLVDYATHWSNRIFKDIAEAKKRSVRFGKRSQLSIGHQLDHIDVRMCKSGKNVRNSALPFTMKTHTDHLQEATVYVALASKDVRNQGRPNNHSRTSIAC